MSDDQSFYEIQLNTPHLVLAFLAATVVGVTIFWFGVVIGRGQPGEAGQPTAGPGAGEDWQASAPIESGEPEELEFYEAVNEPTTQAPAGSPPSSTAADAETAAGEGDAGGAAAPDFTPADPVEEAPAPVAATSTSGLPEPDASLASGWVVQVRSTPERPAADSLQSTLSAAGFPAFVVSAEVSGVTYYRVRVGRYRSRGEAEIIEAELQKRDDVDTPWVTEG